ncbi:MAG: TonB-dependent receptor [Odoribacter sp.]|nr:TonB-dependent receptor [Odoribacter sp.]
MVHLREEYLFFRVRKIGWNIKNSSFLRNSDIVSNLTVRAEYGINGNSRFSSKYGRYYYESIPFRDISGMTRAGVPNNKIKPEKIHTTNIGVDFALVGNRLRVALDLYEETTKEMLLQKDIASVYGFSYMYDNAGEIRTRGIELAISSNLINTNNWNWNVGGNISTFKSEVRSLGGPEEKIITFSDGTKLISKVGKAPNQFYGYEAEKIFYTRREAESADYISHSGLKFAGGDVKFKDLNGDKVIDDEDMRILGNPMPDFYGGFYTDLRYKGFGLYMNFTYSYGNKIYNAVRRGAESMSNFNNQSKAVEKRWIKDGDITDLPRAVYGDQIGNSRFSSRWIEDGSYLKLKEITLSYETNRKLLFFNQIKAYVTMENLFTVTKYLGLDPEFSYSYDPLTLGMDLGKVPLPKTAKVGLILNF